MKNLAIVLVFFSVALQSHAEWKHESELGIVLASGNTVSQTENAKHKSEVKWDKNTVKAGGQYIHSLTESGGTKTSFEIWQLGLKYERDLSEKFGIIAGNEWDGNRDAGYDYRSSLDLGGKYTWYKEKETADYLFNEVGYRFTYEQKVAGTSPPLTRSHFLRVFTEWGKQWSDTTKLKWWLEVLPDFSDSENIEVNSEPSLSVNLNKILSLKLAYLIKYDNVPAVAGLKRFDTLYTTTLVASY